MNSDLARLILAKGLGEASVVLAEVSSLALAAVSHQIIKPQSPWHFAVVHRMSLALARPRESGRPIARTGSLGLPVSVGGYQTVATWTVGSGRFGNLREVSLDSSDLSVTTWQLTIAGTQQFTGQVYLNPLTLPFPLNQLPAGAVVTLAVDPTGGPATAKGSISGSEWYPYIFSLRLKKQGGVTSHTLYASSDLIEHGFPMWAYISDIDPLYLDITNTNGLGGEYFLARFEVINTDETRMNEIIRVTRQMGLPEAVQMVTPIPDPARLAFSRRG